MTAFLSVGNGLINSQILRYIASPEAAASPLGNELAILDLKSNEYFTLNESGAFLWGLLQISREVEDLVRHLLDNFDVEEADARREVADFLEELSNAGLVQTDYA